MSNLRDEVIRVNKIADAVVEVSAAIKNLKNGKLNSKAILVLLAHSTGLPQRDIKKVLDGLDTLAKTYVKQ